MTLHVEELKALAQAKVADAELLFQHRRYSNSYYLFGYGVEFGLKAIIAKTFLAGVIPIGASSRRCIPTGSMNS